MRIFNQYRHSDISHSLNEGHLAFGDEIMNSTVVFRIADLHFTLAEKRWKGRNGAAFSYRSNDVKCETDASPLKDGSRNVHSSPSGNYSSFLNLDP